MSPGFDERHTFLASLGFRVLGFRILGFRIF